MSVWLIPTKAERVPLGLPAGLVVAHGTEAWGATTLPRGGSAVCVEGREVLIADVVQNRWWMVMTTDKRKQTGI